MTTSRLPCPGRLLELLLQVVHVAVGVAEPLGLGEADAVDDGGVVEGVGDDRVLRTEDGLEHAAVGVEAGGVEDRVLLAEERREPLLQLLVDLLRAADEADRGHPVAPAVQCLVGGGDHLGVVGEAQVVVGAEVEHLTGAATGGDGDGRGLRGADHALGLVESGGLDLVEGRAHVVAYGVEHEGCLLVCTGRYEVGQTVQSRMTLPPRPLAASSKAASKSR